MPGIWRITDQGNGISPLVDMYLIEGNEKALLIDAGGNKEEDLAGLVSSLTDKPVSLALTHGHGDHAGGIGQFDQVFLSHKDINTLNLSFDFNIEESMVADLKGGEIFDLGGRKLETIPVPGHTPGSMVFLDRERSLLFSGDSLGSGYFWIQLPHSTSVKAYIKALDRLDGIISGISDLRLFVGHSNQSDTELGQEYISDLRTAAGRIVSGKATGEPFLSHIKEFRGLTASYGQMKGFVYNPKHIYE